MNSSRKTAIIVGVLFIIGTATGVLAAAMTQPVLSAPDYLTKLAASEYPVTLAALLVFIMGAACAGIGIALYPVLRPYHEGLALGAAGFRIMEGVFDIVGVIGLLALLNLSREFVKAGAPAASHFQTLGALLTAGSDWVNSVAVLVTWCIGALMYYAIFYQFRLVPRWLSAWGLAGCTLTIAASLLVMFGLISHMSVIQGVMNLPIALQEMVLAVWLIVKGFSPAMTSSGAEPEASRLSPLRANA